MDHWDAISEFITHTPSGHTSADEPTEIKDLEKPETNNLLARNLIRDFLIARIKKNIDNYISSETFIQHSALIPDGLDHF